MPYIKTDMRSALEFLNPLPSNEGELNYAISHLCHRYVQEKCKNGLSYAVLNSVIGVLDCAKMELYRVVASPYEDVKRRENGSVSSLDEKLTSVDVGAAVRMEIGKAFGLHNGSDASSRDAIDANRKPAEPVLTDLKVLQPTNQSAKEPATDAPSQVLSAAPTQVSSAEEPAKTSNKRRPAQVVGASPVVEKGQPNLPAVPVAEEANDGTVVKSFPKDHEKVAVPKHLLSVWDRAANGKDDEDDI